MLRPSHAWMRAAAGALKLVWVPSGFGTSVHMPGPVQARSAPCRGHAWAVFSSQRVKFKWFWCFCIIMLHASPALG